MPDGPVRPSALEGIRVVDAATLVAGPLVATTLGEMGADVIKIEQPGTGDPLRTWGDARDDIGLVGRASAETSAASPSTCGRRPGSSCCTGYWQSQTSSSWVAGRARSPAGVCSLLISSSATRGWWSSTYPATGQEVRTATNPVTAHLP